ncbi:hypothetical protein F5X98DRAFT_87611 [Xylaria grammica]|nr:hypothetical protein F5X98DRAFT_87611 [Xylaria grammica]
MAATSGWDYIIVGGGLAGSVLAGRLLLHKPSPRILVLEAGPDVSHRDDILYFESFNFVGGEFDWNYKSVPQKSYDGRQIALASGRALGGGSVVNGCAWMRGARADYDDWAAAVGDARWSYEGQLPYFKKTEAWYKDKNAENHGQDGALHIESPMSTGRHYPLADAVEQSWHALGVETIPEHDMNGGRNIGLGELNENRHKGARQIASTVYSLKGATVLTDTLVESVLVDDASGSPAAKGVRLANGTEYHGAEIILSAGAYRTPQLLLLSGIGPRVVLEQHGIKPKVELPGVGQNFNDHALLFLNWRLKDPSKGDALGSAHPRWTEPQFTTGMPASFVVSTTIPNDGLQAAIAEDGQPDRDAYLLSSTHAMMENIVLYFGVPPQGPDGAHISTALMGMKPTSRGSVSISSTNPADPPVLDPNYFSTAVDRHVWRVSLRAIAALMTGDNTPLGRDVVLSEAPPGESAPLAADASDAYLDEIVKTRAVSMFHGSGSCAMGSVVESDLRVKGVRNLRIVDASVFPVSIGGHIQAATYALAEQAAEIIISEAKLS